MPQIYPENFESKIGFDNIRERLKKMCISVLGEEWVDTIAFTDNYAQIDRLTGETLEFLQIIRDTGANFPVDYYFDVRPALEKARVVGVFLETYDLFDLKRSLESIRGIAAFFKNQDDECYPFLRQLAGRIQVFPYILERIDAIISKHGSVKDSASSELGTIRKNIISKQSSVSKRMQQILRKAVNEGIIEQDANVAIRDGRPVIPVPAASKRRLGGIIHDESATGKTAFIEPAEIVEVNNEIRELEYAEKREIVKILTSFTDDIRPYIDDMVNAYELLGNFDFIRAKALFANDVEGLKPDIKDECMLQWQQAKHPLLLLALRKEKRKIIPLDISLLGENRILLISGPNAGGKSVCLKTVGLLQYMLQCGLLVPVGEESAMGIFGQLFIDIGDEQSIENDLSTYSSHLLNMKHCVKYSNERTLVLIDEFGTGTEPMIGGAIAEAILNRLNAQSTFGVITTHYTNLKHFASSARGIINGAMLYDSHKMEPLFQLQIGKPGSSFAFEIARKIGLSEEILQEASEKVGKDHIHFDKHLKDIVRDKRYWESKRKKIRQAEKKLDELIVNYQKDLEEAGRMRKDILEKAKEEAGSMLSEANRKIENTIFKIKEAQAEKERTRNARKELETFKKEHNEGVIEEEKRIARKIDKIKEREKQRAREKGEGAKTVQPAQKPLEEFNVGDKVKLAGQDTIGEVMEVGEKNVVVALGHLISSVERKRLEHVSNNEARKKGKQGNKTMAKVNEQLSSKRLKFKAELDVRGLRVGEALQKVQEFIDNAIMLNVTEVKILHGTGNGILRQTIREFLKTEPVVKRLRDEHVQFGGTGITIVTLD